MADLTDRRYQKQKGEVTETTFMYDTIFKFKANLFNLLRKLQIFQFRKKSKISFIAVEKNVLIDEIDKTYFQNVNGYMV